MAVFEELNRHSERLQDPEARKAQKIERAKTPQKKRGRSSSVSVSTYKRTKIIINVAVVVVVVSFVVFFGYQAIRMFIE